MNSLERWIEWLPALLSGLQVSLVLTFFVALLGFPLGLLLGVLNLVKSKLVRTLTIAFVEVFRGVPLLVVVYFVYFGFPDFGIMISDYTTIVLAFSVNLAAYSSEVFRAGLLHVGTSQREAAQALGMTRWHAFLYVILPQALRAIPGPLMSWLILVFQYTSLGFAIGISELTGRAFSIGTRTFQFFDVLLLAGVMYAVICIISSQIVSRVEKKLSTTS